MGIGQQGEVRGIQGTVKWCGSFVDVVMGRVIGMKGTSKGCGSSADEVIGYGQRDKGYWQMVWFFWGWGKRDEGYWQKVWSEGFRVLANCVVLSADGVMGSR